MSETFLFEIYRKNKSSFICTIIDLPWPYIILTLLAMKQFDQAANKDMKSFDAYCSSRSRYKLYVAPDSGRSIWSTADSAYYYYVHKRGHPAWVTWACERSWSTRQTGVHACIAPCELEWKKVVPLDQGNRPHTHSDPNISMHCAGWLRRREKSKKERRVGFKLHGAKEPIEGAIEAFGFCR